MPSNAAKKLRNKAKARLPVFIKHKRTKTTESQKYKRNNTAQDNTETIRTATTRKLLEQQKQTQQKQHTTIIEPAVTTTITTATTGAVHKQAQQQDKNSLSLVNLKETSSTFSTIKNNTQTTTTTATATSATTTTTKTTQSISISIPSTITTATTTTTISRGTVVDANNAIVKSGSTTNRSSESTTTATTLYPIVIEKSQQQNLTTATTAVVGTVAANCAFNKTLTPKTTAITTFECKTVTAGLLKKNNNKNTTKKRRTKSLNCTNSSATNENCRLSTLRARKSTTYVLPTKQPIEKHLSHQQESVKQVKVENKQEEEEQERDIRSFLNDITTTIKAKPVNQHLDEAFLNKIETLESCEVKKASVKKRRRGNSVSLNINVYATGTRRRSSIRSNLQSSSYLEAAASSSNNNTYDNLNNKSINSSSAITTATFKPVSALNTNNSSSKAKKRVCTMSLYERRYQNEDGGRGVVSNGYLTSTRNSSLSGGNIVHSDATDAQDLPGNQYYISTSMGSSGGVATLGGSSSALNNVPAMATLCNIGNTCYLNSVVYTLRFAPQFLHNLHHLIVDLSAVQQSLIRHRAKSSSLGRGMSALHVDNVRSWSSKDLASLEQYNSTHAPNPSGGTLTQKGGHQMLTERLHELYQSLHRNEVSESTEPFHADTLLHAIQDVSAIFEGNQQQDAHEFLMCLLNSIRETCQTLIKVIAECPDVISNGYISNLDELDAANAYERDTNNTNHSQQSSSGSNSTSTTSSLSTSNITKSYFFSRKSKRKEETKLIKNSRMQSPLKDGGNSGAGGGGGLAQQPTSNSLFYLNTVDLSSAPATTTTTQGFSSAPNSATATKSCKTDVETTPPLGMPIKDKERLAEKIRELGLDFFSEDFEGVTVSTTKCLSCETVTEQKESMIDIAVPVPIAGYADNIDYNSTEKPSSFIQNSCITREYFRGENKYRCEQCTGYTEAIRSISYEVLPRLLVIQLSRFSGGMEKINSYTPTAFTLQCFCAKCCKLNESNKLHVYKLYSVITHVGATMSVGHYIAYTCALDWTSEYMNCPKDRRNTVSQQQQLVGANGLYNNNGSTSSTATLPTTQMAQASSAASAAASVLASSGTSLMKKMKFGRSKASSSSDMSKHMKQLNGITSKSITNGIGKLSMNTTCHSLNCCATRLCTTQQQLHLQQQQQQQPQLSSCSDVGEDALALQNGSMAYGVFQQFPAGGYGSTGRGGNKHNHNVYNSTAVIGGSNSGSGCVGVGIGGGSSNSVSSNSGIVNVDPIWYMCDDDKIKAMTQKEFEDLLSPSRKITITPYLLFYARFDLQPTGSTASQPTPTKQTPSPQASWSSESLQSGSGGGSIASVVKM